MMPGECGYTAEIDEACHFSEYADIQEASIQGNNPKD